MEPIAPVALDHVSLAVTDLARACRFYGEVLGLRPLPRPAFDFPGAWYAIGDAELHLIERPDRPPRTPLVDSRGTHVALRVADYERAVRALACHGYAPDAPDPARRTREVRTGRAGFPQVFLLDPDGHVLELNGRA